jgi:Icc-related predicted phosphoesterase
VTDHPEPLQAVPLRADVLFTSDLHGHRPFYEATLDLARRLRARALLLGGDLAPHGDVAAQRAFFAGTLLPLVSAYLAEPDAADIFYVFGNDDWRANLPLLADSGIPRLHHIHRVVRPFLDSAWIAGLASVPMTPFRMKDWDRWEEGLDPGAAACGQRSAPDGVLHPFDFRGREEAESLKLDLEPIEAATGPSRRPLVCMFHGPPHGTALDQIGGGIHVGSREVRRFLERSRPLLALHGHIHESPNVSGRFADRVGETICVNPGQHPRSGLHAIWFDLNDVAGTLAHTLFGPARL